MKAFFLAIAIFAFLLVRAPELKAQVYIPYPYWYDPQYQYWQYQNYLQWQQYLQYLQQTDPYYDLHVMHFQLYLQPYQSYLIYPPCCFLPSWSSGYRPRWGIGGGGQAIRPRLPAPVTPTPRGPVTPRPPGGIRRR
jgi:hypothetical protein